MENSLVQDKYVLFAQDEYKEFQNFFGIRVNSLEKLLSISNLDQKIIYLAWDIEAIYPYVKQYNIRVIVDFSTNFLESGLPTVSKGEVPIDIHGVGVQFRQFFGDVDYFSSFANEHKVQRLTESNKDDFAYRRGIYITPVTQLNPTARKFNLLRCSTNLEGPTDNVRTTDIEIMRKLNITASELFTQNVVLNHVLAQIYYNQQVGTKDRKARIASHSDKTKDMPKNAVMAFCTFYDSSELSNKQYHDDIFGGCYYKHASVLTTLRFKLKDCVTDQKYVKEFDVTLYPNSVFFMTLETNRLYRHEIVPPNVSSDLMPTRLGYVVRCSATEATHADGKTFILTQTSANDTLIEQVFEELRDPTDDGIAALKQNYMKENIYADHVDYGFVNFSLNRGDYMNPNL